ncbi:MAG TPA: aldolase/citrate lyase family protein [Victivallales bacterium]|nr:aldolase/citrate lyase family protein [Victivallales bacterium]
MQKSFKKRLLDKELMIGTDISLPSPEIAEILENAGFDWLFVDFEHSIMDIKNIQQIIQAVNIPCVVRCPSDDEVWIKKCLDIGASGIIIPQIKDIEQIENVVKYSKYRPIGERCTGIGRANKYGQNFHEYLKNANDNIVTIIQIENKEAVALINDIVKVEGLDAVFIGPLDLSDSLGKTGQVDSPEVLKAISKVRDTCIKSNMPLSIFTSNTQAAEKFISDGFSLMTISADILLLSDAAKDIVNEFK